MSGSPDLERSPWIDVSRPLEEGLAAWPGDPPFCACPVSTVEQHGARVSRLEMSSHAGTHIDAPAHFIAGGRGVDALDLALLVGECQVIDAPSDDGCVGRTALEQRVAPDTRRLLIRTRRADDDSPPPPPAAGQGHLDEEAAQWLVKREIRLVGIDALSIDAFDSARYPVHHALLGAEVIIVEGLDLRGIDPGRYDLIALPLRLTGADGSPASVLLRKRA